MQSLRVSLYGCRKKRFECKEYSEKLPDIARTRATLFHDTYKHCSSFALISIPDHNG